MVTSPEAQREQGEAYAKAHNIIITETIILLESASHEEQPMQKVIDACKDASKGFQVVLIKSIDRFTRWWRPLLPTQETAYNHGNCA